MRLQETLKVRGKAFVRRKKKLTGCDMSCGFLIYCLSFFEDIFFYPLLVKCFHPICLSEFVNYLFATIKKIIGFPYINTLGFV